MSNEDGLIPTGESRSFQIPQDGSGKQLIENKGKKDIPIRLQTQLGSEITFILHPGACISMSVKENVGIHIEESEYGEGLRLVENA